MKTTAIISAIALIGSSAALPAEDAAAVSSKPFTGTALRSASPIHFLPVTAAGSHFYLGGHTSSYCPSEVKKCPKGKYTAFAGGAGSIYMDVEVPGGQAVYIEKNGALGFTQAHSAYMPPGSTTGGFTRENVKGQNYDLVGHKKGLYACKNKDKEYQVFVGVDGFNKKGCLGFEMAATPFKGFGAWQYE